MQRIRVLLPLPLGPQTTTTFPAAMLRSMSLSTCSAPNHLLTLVNSITVRSNLEKDSIENAGPAYYINNGLLQEFSACSIRGHITNATSNPQISVHIVAAGTVARLDRRWTVIWCVTAKRCRELVRRSPPAVARRARREVNALAQTASARGVAVAWIYHSGILRAQQTAESGRRSTGSGRGRARTRSGYAPDDDPFIAKAELELTQPVHSCW